MMRQIDVVLEPVLASPAMRALDRKLRAVANKEVSILLVGESGSGKEILARRIHDLSSRRTGGFVPINCAAIPETLFESEVFGHEKGAFTSASERARGKIEAADGGTLFLDEVGEMPLTMQAKLLRFLENHRFMRVGGSKKISVDVRLICATLRPLEVEVAERRFRADLFYRIQGISLGVPPLRERRADIAPLVDHFIAELCSKHDSTRPKLSRMAKAALRQHSWPGNVRELRNAIELLVLLRGGKTVRIQDLPEAVTRARVISAPPKSVSVEVSLDDSLKASVDEIVRAALELEHGNQSRAARRLGLSLRTMQRYIARGSSSHTRLPREPVHES